MVSHSSRSTEAAASNQLQAPSPVALRERAVDRTPGNAETLRDRSGTQRGPQLPDLRRVVRARSSAASSDSRDDRWLRAALPIIASSKAPTVMSSVVTIGPLPSGLDRGDPAARLRPTHIRDPIARAWLAPGLQPQGLL